MAQEKGRLSATSASIDVHVLEPVGNDDNGHLALVDYRCSEPFVDHYAVGGAHYDKVRLLLLGHFQYLVNYLALHDLCAYPYALLFGCGLEDVKRLLAVR